MIIFFFASLVSAVAHVKKVMDKNPARQVSTAVENMLKTGRLVTQTGLDLQQVRLASDQLVYVLAVIIFQHAIIFLFPSL